MRILYSLKVILFISFIACYTPIQANNLSFTAEKIQKQKREVKCATKNGDGVITEIGGDWGTISAFEAIQNIESGKFEYYAICKGSKVTIQVIPRSTKQGKIIKYLRTDPNNTKCDNLDFLPSCSK